MNSTYIALYVNIKKLKVMQIILNYDRFSIEMGDFSNITHIP